ncbi:hypothetical protein JN06_02486 [Bacteroides zoogleoformans]|nr:hypothetical protein JN06_02486 [Bacteroides zoogleoformans]
MKYVVSMELLIKGVNKGVTDFVGVPRLFSRFITSFFTPDSRIKQKVVR